MAMNSIMTTFSNWQPANLDLGDEHAIIEARQTEFRRIIFKLCEELEGDWKVFFFATLSMFLSAVLTIVVIISPFEDITVCRRFFMILSCTFLFNQSFFIVNLFRDRGLLPTVRLKDDPAHEHARQEDFSPMRYHPEAYILKSLNPKKSVPLTPNPPNPQGKEARKKVWTDMDVEMCAHPDVWLQFLMFMVTCAAMVVCQAIMDAAPESRMYLILTSAYLLTTSLNFASVWRDRFASRVWKYQVAGPENPHKRINASDFVYHTRNIWRAVEGKWLMILWFIIGVGAVVCLALTMFYLKELAEGDHEAGCGLVSVSIFFYACFAFILAYVLIGPTPHWQKEEEKHMGFLGGVIPIAGFFIIAIGLEVAGILLFKITITQTMCIILGELIMGDAIFNFLKIFFKMKRVDGYITHIVRSVGENHIVHGLKGGESIKDRMIRAPTDGLQKLFPGGGGHGH